MAVSVCFVFTVTIGVFPSITAKVSTVLGEGNTWGKCGQGWGGVGGIWEQGKWAERQWGLKYCGCLRGSGDQCAWWFVCRHRPGWESIPALSGKLGGPRPERQPPCNQQEGLGHPGLVSDILPILQVSTSSLSPASFSLMSLTGQDGVSPPSSHG